MTDTLERGGLPVNHQQAQIIDSVCANQVTTASAGAGSGKTYTMIAAVLELIQQQHASLHEFALITFTNSAAEDLHSRLVEELTKRTLADPSGAWSRQEEGLSAGYIGTIHGFCQHTLRTFGYAAQIARASSTTMSRRLESQALSDAMEAALTGSGSESLPELGALELPSHQLDAFVRRVLNYCRTVDISVSSLLNATRAQPDDPGKPYRVAVASLLGAATDQYTLLKRQAAVLDTDDLLTRLARLFDGLRGNVIAARVASRHPYLFVDEFQDTDRTQKTIIDHLVPHLTKLLVVGDQKQAIYGFRAADHSLLAELSDEHAGRPPLPLSMSKRPTRQLLDAQNALFDVMGDRYPELAEPLEPFDAAPFYGDALTPVIHLACVSAEGPRRVAAYLGSLVEQVHLPDECRPVEAGDVVILTRSNRLAERYEQEVGDLVAPSGLAVRREVGGGFYDQPEIVSTFRTLELVLNYRHDLALSMALHTPYFAGIDSRDQEKWILQYQPADGAPLTDWFENAHPELAGPLAELRAAVRTDTAPQFLGRLYQSFPIQAYYMDRGDTRALENLERLREIARRLFRNEEALSLRIFAEWLRTAIQFERDEEDESLAPSLRPTYVRIMTIHRAKGREFPVVIVPGLSARLDRQGDDPTFFADTTDGFDSNLRVAGGDARSPTFDRKVAASKLASLREEMRLLYVAITRAQHQVVLVGGGTRPGLNTPDDEWYSWSDEVLGARIELEYCGAEFI